jgi:hypothetical protein
MKFHLTANAVEGGCGRRRASVLSIICLLWLQRFSRRFLQHNRGTESNGQSAGCSGPGRKVDAAAENDAGRKIGQLVQYSAGQATGPTSEEPTTET